MTHLFSVYYTRNDVLAFRLPMKNTKPKMLTITETAKKLGISRQAVHEAILKGQLEAEKTEVVQEVWKVPEPAVKKYRVSTSHRSRGRKAR